MGLQNTGRYLRRPSVIVLFLICGFIYYSMPRGDSHEALHVDDEATDDEASPRTKINVATTSGYYEVHPDKIKKAEEKKRFKDALAKLPSEVTVGTKKYVLFEKKKMRFVEAKRFCRGLENGRLGRASRLIETGEISQLELLLKKAAMLSQDVWIGISRRKWRKLTKPKKPPKKEEDDDERMSPHHYDMMGGGYGGGGSREAPCPSLSVSQKQIHPTYCMRQLPIICEINSDPNWSKTGRRSRFRSPPMRSLEMDENNDNDNNDNEGEGEDEIVGDIKDEM